VHAKCDGGAPHDAIAEMKKVYETSTLSGSLLHCRAFKKGLALLKVNHHVVDQ
jgi:hypothetical protein